MRKLFNWIRSGLDGFVLALIGMIVLASVWQAPGIQKGLFSLSSIANFGVSLIFFFYGLRLNPQKLKEGLNNWRLHIIVQLTTFVLFPLLILVLITLLGTSKEILWLGIFYLASLPSTVSSSVVMVSIAQGNIPAAIFNASVSSLIGVFITPLWMGLFLSTSGGSYDLGPIIGKLILQVLFPVVLGMLLNHKLGAFAEKHKKVLRYSDQTVILLIVYTSFCESFANHMFSGFSVLILVLLGLSMVLLFFAVFFIVMYITRLMHFNREDTITTVFCGSKKSLVHGTVMSKVLFPGSHNVGIVLLPLMMYHALQLVSASMIAQRWAKSTILKKKQI